MTKTKPLFLVKPKTISPKDIQRAERLSGICIVECEDPEATRLLEPPFDAGLSAQTRAALSLMRYVASAEDSGGSFFHVRTLHKFIVNALIGPEPAKVRRVTKK